MTPAEREARILQYWRAVELFSPQKIPRLNPNNRKEPVLRTAGETPLPWDSSRWLHAPDAGHAAAVAPGYFAYNFIKIHRTLRVTPAMAAGVTDRLWEVSDLVALIEAEERGLERAA